MQPQKVRVRSDQTGFGEPLGRNTQDVGLRRQPNFFSGKGMVSARFGGDEPDRASPALLVRRPPAVKQTNLHRQIHLHQEKLIE